MMSNLSRPHRNRLFLSFAAILCALLSLAAQPIEPGTDEPFEIFEVRKSAEGTGKFRITVNYDVAPPGSAGGLPVRVSAAGVSREIQLVPGDDGLTFESGLLQLVMGEPPSDESALSRLDTAYAGSAAVAAQLFSGTWSIRHTNSDGQVSEGTGTINGDGRSASLQLDTGNGLSRFRSDDLLAVPDPGGNGHILEIRFRESGGDADRRLDPSATQIYVDAPSLTVNIETPYETYPTELSALSLVDNKMIRVLLVATGQHELEGTWSDEDTDGGLTATAQQSWLRGAKIENIFVVENQLELPFPFRPDGTEIADGATTSRKLIVHGRNFRTAVENEGRIKSSSPSIRYRLDTRMVSDGDAELAAARANVQTALDRAEAADRPEPQLQAKLRSQLAALQDTENLAYVDVSLRPGAHPGTETLTVGDANGDWHLLFSNQKARLQFSRFDDQIRDEPTMLFYPGDIAAVDIAFETDMPFEQIGIRLMRQAPDDVDDPRAARDALGHILLAKRLGEDQAGDEAIFRTEPIHFVSDSEPGFAPPSDPESFVLHVNDGDIIGARLVDAAKAFPQPRQALAKISGVSEDLGELWKGALRKAAACNGDSFDGDPRYALEVSTKFSRITIGELVRFVSPLANIAAELSGAEDSPINFNPSVQVYHGDHAAAILIRDVLVEMMASPSVVVPLSAIADNDNGAVQAVRARAVANGPENEPLIARNSAFWTEPPRSTAKRLWWRLKSFVDPSTLVMEVPLSETLDVEAFAERVDALPEDVERWAVEATQQDAKELLTNLNQAIGRAQDAGDCNVEELMVVAGQKADAAVARIIPQLMIKVNNPGPPATSYWRADRLARGFVERLHLAGEAVRALDQYGAIDDAYKAMAFAAVTAGIGYGLSAAGFSATAAGFLIAADVADAAYFGARDLDRALESQAFYDYANGASLVLGDEILNEAEANLESTEMAMLGLIAPAVGGFSGLNDIRHVRKIRAGKELAAELGPDIFNRLDDLDPVQRSDFRSYLTELLTDARSSGYATLDPNDQALLKAFSDFETQINEQPVGLLRIDLPPEADPRGPYIGLSERLGPEYRRAFDSDYVPDRFYDPLSDQRAVVRAEDGRLSIRPTGNQIYPDAEEIVFGETALGQGSFNTAFPIDDDWIARVPGGLGGRPEIKALAVDRGGREIFEQAFENADDESRNLVRLVELDKRVKVDHPMEILASPNMQKNVKLNPGDEIEVVENFTRGSLKDNIEARELKRMTDEELIAFSKGVRELNSRGLVGLDLKWDNFGFEPVAEGSDELRLVILDPGGIVPMKNYDPVAARQLQSMMNSASHGKTGRLPMKYAILSAYGDAIDSRAIGISEVWDIPFAPVGVSNLERARQVASLSDDEAEALYISLRQAGANQ